MPKAETSEAPAVTIRGAGAEQKLFGRYTLKRVLGRGGMGIVWLAHDDELKRSVAMKFLPDMIVRDREAVEDLKRETRRSLDLTHHHIVRIYDFTQDENSAAIIMEYVDGETLSAMKTQQPGGCFAVSTLSIWAGHFCQALDYAHRQARVVHRDLKPANLMVNSRADLKITDFGISRSMSDSMTRVSMSNTAGTLAYMSPEQALGAPPAASDDVYAFGATIYDLLTGRPPFFRGNLQVQLETVVPPPMNARRAELGNSAEPIPALWEEVIAACLSKKPQERPQSMAEIANLLGIGGPTTGYRPATNFNFAPLSNVIAPATTRETQAGQPPTSPTLQRTLSPDELVTRVDAGPAAPASSKAAPPPPPPTSQPVKPTSMGDVIPGFDFAPEPRARIAPPPATVVPEEVAPEEVAPEPIAKIESPTPEVVAPAPPAEQIEAPAEPTLVEVVDDSFPTIVAQPRVSMPEEVAPAEEPESEALPEALPEAEAAPIAESQEVEPPVAAVEPEVAKSEPASADIAETPEEDQFPTLMGERLEQAAELTPAEVETPLQEQQTPESEQSQDEGSVTLTDSAISLPQPSEEEFPTFAGTPLPEPEAVQDAVLPAPDPEPPVEAAAIETPAPAEPVAFAPHVFSPVPPAAPPYAAPARKPLAPMLLILAIAAVVVGGAVWMGMNWHTGPSPSVREKLAQPFIEQGRTYLTTGALDDADNQIRLALEKNPGDARALQLQQDVAAKRKSMEEQLAEAQRKADEKRTREMEEQKAAEKKLMAEKAAAAEKARKEAQELVADGEKAYPRNLVVARQKAQDALAKVPDFADAQALITKIDDREAKEKETSDAIAKARSALKADEFDDADSALKNVPSEFSSREDVADMRADIAAARRSALAKQATPTPKTRRPDPDPPRRSSRESKPKEREKPPVADKPDRDTDERPQRTQPSKPERTKKPELPAPPIGRSKPPSTPRPPGLPNGGLPPGG